MLSRLWYPPLPRWASFFRALSQLSPTGTSGLSMLQFLQSHVHPRHPLAFFLSLRLQASFLAALSWTLWTLIDSFREALLLEDHQLRPPGPLRSTLYMLCSWFGFVCVGLWGLSPQPLCCVSLRRPVPLLCPQTTNRSMSWTWSTLQTNFCLPP